MDSLDDSVGREVALFFAIAVSWTWFFWGIPALVTSGFLSISISNDIFTALGGFGPLLAALLLTYSKGGKHAVVILLKRGVNYRFEKKWWLPILLLIPVVFLVSYFIVSLLQMTPPLDINRFLSKFPMQFIYFFLGVAIAEEFGWRGYALDRLQRRMQGSGFTAVISSVILGVIWGFWHLPFFFTAGTSQSGWSFWYFLWLTILVSILFTWLHNNTNGSVLTALFFHTSLNLCVNFVPILLVFFYYPALTTDLAFIVMNLIASVIILSVVAYWGPETLTRKEGMRERLRVA
ncbi:MAG: CPBP family intramembrane metalloprotease [Candidatus Thorarchaeota archaeon]|nr:CPBP family intramembrane metalloprotease [Candidatus Thorarchaeota archaeon]